MFTGDTQAGAGMSRRHGDEMTRLPFLRTWFRTRSAIVLHLSNGTLQVRLSNTVSVSRVDSRVRFRVIYWTGLSGTQVD